MRWWVLVPWLGAAGMAAGEERPVGTESPENFGAVVAPAAMPDGATAVSGWVGVPELGAVFRQGIGGWEVGARARFDYLRLAVTGEALVRKQMWSSGAWRVAPELGLGVTGNSGSNYLLDNPLRGWFLRVDPAVVASLRLAETVAAVGLVEVPYDVGLSPAGAWRIKPLAGGGLEVYLGEDLSLSAVGELGVDVLKEVRGVPETRLGYGVRLGLGVRLF